MEQEPAHVAILELDLRVQRDMALHRPDPAHLRADDGDRLAFDHRLDRHVFDLAGLGKQGAPRAKGRGFAELRLYGAQLLPDPLPLQPVRAQQVIQTGPFLEQGIIFPAQLDLFQLAQGPQPHVQNGFGLRLGQFAFGVLAARHGRHIILLGHGARMRHAPAFGDQRALGIGVIADDVDHAVQVQEGNDEAFKDLQPCIDLFQPVLAAPPQHVAPVIQKGAQHLFQRADARHAPVDQHVHVQRKADLQIRIAKQHAHQHVGVHRAGPRFQHDAHVFCRFVAHIGQRHNLLGLDQFGQPFDQLRFLHLIGNLGNHDLPGAPAQILDRPFRAQPERAAPRAIGVHDRGARFHDGAAGGEIGAGHQRHDGLVAAVGLAHHQLAGVDQLVQIVRRNVGGHAHGDAGRPIRQQVGKGGGHDDRLFQRAVIVGPEIHRVFGQPLHQKFRQRGQARLGVAAGGGVVAVDIAEVALPVDQRVAQVEILGEPRHRVIDRRVAMRVIIAHHIAGNLGRFAKAPGGRQAQLAHREQDAAMHRLQPVPGIGQGAVHDGGQRIGQIALADGAAQRFRDQRRLDLGVVRWFRHACCVAPRTGTVQTQPQARSRRFFAGRAGSGMIGSSGITESGR